MRRKRTKDGLTVRAIAGTYVVLLGWSMSREDSAGILGFAVHRTDRTEDEAYWLSGIKVFQETDPGTSQASLRSHPVQGFTWSDFTAKPDHRYTYRVVALRGTPSQLVESETVRVTVTTESEDAGLQAVFFNRGAAASQEYARRFRNRPPDDVGDPAFRWLSRGLSEALQKFIDRAEDNRYGLRVAAYQFTYDPVLASLRDAHQRGADVKIVYDARNAGVAEPNDRAVQRVQIADLCSRRTANPSFIAHNKFIILLKDGQPEAVWTGSTNLTEGGIFGHSNVGHEIRDRAVAEIYLQYWNLIRANPEAASLRPGVAALTPTPAAGSKPPTGSIAEFSPRSGLQLLQWYADRAASASSLLCATFAFGINSVFVPVLETPFAGLRYALLDSAGTTEDARQTVFDLRRKIFNRFAIGNFVKQNKFDRWIGERLSGLNRHAQFIHTKYMLIDPLGNDPVVISGSANFSNASTRSNDENMLVIRGDRAVADIYLTEFFRLWNHYAFREFAAKQPADSDLRPQFLKPDDSWRRIYFGNTAQARQRQIMSGVSA